MVACSNCRKREAKHQTAMNINGRLVYMSLCDKCFEDLKKESQITDSLDQFSKDLTEYAKEGRLDPVIGREIEIDRVIHILSRRKKNNPVLIGEPGVGKTAIVEGLAQKLYDGSVPEPLRDKRLVSLDLAAMIAGTAHRGAFEKRLKEVIEEVIKTKGQVILFIDELHSLVGAGSAQGSMDAANILKPYLARGELQLVGATTLKEYRTIEKDAALERRFQQILVEEPSHEYSIKILQGLRKNYEAHHQIKITPEAIDSAVKLSSRYISNKFLPDKAIDLIDEAGAALRLELASEEPKNLKEVIVQIKKLRESVNLEGNLENIKVLEEKLQELEVVRKELTALWVQTKLEKTPILTAKHVASVVSGATGIPLSELTQDERFRLQNLALELKNHVVGQDEAIEVVSKAIKRSRAGVRQLDKPIGVFMFLGPTGVGKTELAKSLAKILYGSEDYLIRVDMSEFGERHNVARLVGSPPGYVGFDEGGQLTEQVRRKPFSIVLFDEIEKAHSEVFNILLQVMDDGRLTDGHGLTINFKNTIIIMTSNVGSEYINNDKIGFKSEILDKGVLKPANMDEDLDQVDRAYENISERLNDSLKNNFRPEFLNRIDDVVIFRPLSPIVVEKIVDIEINEVQKNLQENGIRLDIADSAKKYISEKGYSLEMGARPVKRVIQKEIEDRLSELIIENKAKIGDLIRVTVKKDEIDFFVEQNEDVKIKAEV